ncbi:zinc finger protein 578 isoform X1 [Anastrepha obliqua]|uniref:zinc finger protein 578 isoform X1 n=1 Tax=Anastrepha obliqua TaxID=95512 RepID=UPI002409C525|nr:zinc finger protein 578 isoform X1 [Anastrepha obliqua]
MMQSAESAIPLSDNPTEYIDLSDYCRLCLQVPDESQLLDLQLIYDEEEQLSYYDCFTVCTQIDLRAGGTNAPHQLCKSCGLELQVAYDFHKKVEESKIFLEQLDQSQQLGDEVSPLTTTMKIERHGEPEDVGEVEVKTNEPQLVESLPAESEPIENDIVAGQDDTVGHFETSMEYEELEDQIDMDEYQSVDELVDEVQMDYILVEELVSTPSEVILPYPNVSSNHVSICNTLPAVTTPAPHATANKHMPVALNALTSTTPSETSLCVVSSSLNEVNKRTTAMPSIKCEPNSPLPSRACTPDLPIQIIRPKRSSRICCDYCQKSFTSRSKMLLHRRTHEPDRPRFNCSFEGCDRTYLSRQSCELHYKQTHCSREDFQPFECLLCHKIFAISQTLEVHMRYHTRQFPFECPHCERRFGQKGHLTSHLQVKHNNLRYICPETGCGKVFKNTISLRNHSFSHTGMPFRCTYCDRGYPQKSKLKVHLKLKHEVIMSLEELESMRKLKSARTRHSFVKLDIPKGVSEAVSEVAEDSLHNGSVCDANFEDVVEEIEVNV